jgi:hypothetical protein
VIDVNIEHPEKQQDSRYFTRFGIVIDLDEEKFEKQNFSREKM